MKRSIQIRQQRKDKQRRQAAAYQFQQPVAKPARHLPENLVMAAGPRRHAQTRPR